jgi:peroxiredoxin
VYDEPGSSRRGGSSILDGVHGRRSTLLILLALAGCGPRPPPPGFPPTSPSPLVGAPLPDLGRRTLNLGALDREALRDRVVVVEFFAAYCRPCQRSLPAAESLHRRGAARVIGVSLDDDEGAAWQQIQRHRLSFPVIHDRGRLVAGRFRVGELPVSFVVDRRGRVVWVGGPGRAEADLRRAVAAAGR